MTELYSYGRKISYLRLSITDKCNLRCRYCMPEEGLPDIGHGNLLRVEEMLRLLSLFRRQGIDKLRITGGEPLVSRHLLPLLTAIKPLAFADIALTTNGQLLPKLATQLLDKGVCRLNISLDTLNEERFAYITRGGRLQDTLKGIEAALQAGFKPVKVNCVLVRGFNDDEIMDMALLAKDKPVSVRFIELMPLGGYGMWNEKSFVPIREAKEIISSLGQLKPGLEPLGNGPAEVFAIEGFAGTVGFIDAISGHFCHRCNRLRLTADGLLHPCLHSCCSVDLLTPLRKGARDEEIIALIDQAVMDKPREHDFWGAQKRSMNTIGG